MLTLKKHKTRKSDLHRCNEEKLCAKTNDLFDIAHADVATIINIPEDLEFLAAQREPERITGTRQGQETLRSGRAVRGTARGSFTIAGTQRGAGSVRRR